MSTYYSNFNHIFLLLRIHQVIKAVASQAHRSIEFEIFRIAIGKNVFFNDCLLSFHIPSAKSLEATLHLEYKKETRRNQNRSLYATRLRGIGNTSDTESEYRLHRINMTQELLEFKFYIPEQYPNQNKSTIDDATDDTIHLTNNLLAMRVQVNDDNGLNAFPNAYKPDSDDPERQWIIVELCTEGDMNDFLRAMRIDLNLSVFVTEECKLSPKQALACCQSLLKDNAVQEQRAHRENARAKSIGTFLHGKGQEDVLLIYPFGADAKAIDNASKGLKELSCVLDYENNKPGPNEVNVARAAKEKEVEGLEGKATDDPSGEESRAVLTLAVSTIERLESGVYLNDTLIDFWQQWIWRNTDRSLVHYFTTLFFTTLEENDTESVKRWTEKRGVDVFSKRFIFIPINKTLHWSLCVVVNPGAIVAHRNRLLDDSNSNTADLLSDDDPFPCILFFDSLQAHAKGRCAKLVRTWLNSEWKRLHPQQMEQSPFDVKSMRLYTPKIPYQNNSWDCGVYVCRYMYAMYLLRSHTFTYSEVGYSRNAEGTMFVDLITKNAAFRFDGEDIVRIRYEFMTLIERLSKLFLTWKADDDRQRLEARRLKKVEVLVNNKIETAPV
jgi:sentrin-specific protease 7